MKKHLLPFIALLACTAVSNAQTELAPDQNPNYTVSRDKYMKMADSLTRWHSTTLQDTYEAIDWIADKEKAKDRRRELRLERARWSSYDYYSDSYYDNRYRNRNNYSPYYNYPNNRWQRSRYWWW